MRSKVPERMLLIACGLLLSSCEPENARIELTPKESSTRIELGGEWKRAMEFPLSEEVEVTLTLPRDAELTFSPAVVTEHRIPRARVEFRAEISVEGGKFEVYRRELRARGQNQWHDARVDLGAWSGKTVTLTLAASPPSGASEVPWASRVRPVWGEPSVGTRITHGLVAGERPSYVVLLVDTLRADYLGAYGFDAGISPNLDRLAAESVVFENAFSNAPWTKPSIATLFTSLPPAVHGVTSMGKASWSGEGSFTQVLSDEAETLAETFRDAGYRTAAFVANPFVSPRHGFSQGFERFLRIKDTPTLFGAATEWLAERAPGREPFLLYLHVMDVHGPYDSPRSDFEAVLSQMVQMGRVDSRTLTEADYAQIPGYMRRVQFASEEERYQLSSWRARYGAGIRVLDRAAGPFLDELRASGVLDRAYLVLASDHGEELLEHGGWNHGNNLYDHQLHVPLWIRQPLAKDAGRRIPWLASLIDVMPTLTGLAGIVAPAGVLGRDLSMVFRGGAPPQNAAIFAEAVNGNPKMAAVRTLSQKLIWDERRQEFSFFDLGADPAECCARSSKANAAVARLESYLRDQHARNVARGVLTPQAIPMEKELEDQLKALGYVH